MFSTITNGIISTDKTQNQTNTPGSVDEVVIDEIQNAGGEQFPEIPDGLLKINILKTDKEFGALEEEWNRLLEKADAHIFQTYEWQKLWWEQFGDKNRLHILTFRDRGKLVGIAPFHLEETYLAGFCIHRTLQFLGGRIPAENTQGAFSNYSPSDYLDLIADPKYQQEIAETLLNYWENNGDSFDQISLDELPEEGIMMQSVFPGIEERGWIHKKEKREVCPQIKLPESMDEYLYQIKRSIRYKLRTSMRKVSEENLYKVSNIENDRELEFVFDNLVDLHQQRWNKQGYPGAFANKQVERFLREVSKAFLKRNWLQLKSSFDHEGNCLAVNLAFTFNNRVYDYQKAFDITSELAKHSPGFALSYFLIEEGIARGDKVFDLLRGGHKYKLRLASTAPQNWKITVYNTSPIKNIKYRLNKLMSGVINFKLRISRELLLLKVHIREWGPLGFVSKYLGFIKDRYEEKASD